MKIAVTSKSFSNNQTLRESLLKKYPLSKFNQGGIQFSEEHLIDYLKDSDAAIIGLEKINDAILSQLPNLKVISKYGVGLDNIDMSSLNKFGVKLGYTAGTNRRGVAELALQMMLILIRKSYEANLNLRDGKWKPLFGNNLTHKKVGILGLGNIGKDLVHLLRPFDCNISIYDISPDYDFLNNHRLRLVSIEELFSQNDIVTIHIPLTNLTKDLITSKYLNLMQGHSILINTARGGIVDEAHLFNILKNNQIAAAGFDVFLEEPATNNKLLQLDNFYSTPHIGGSSIESILSMGEAAIKGLDSADYIKLL